MKYKKPELLSYRLAQGVSWVVSSAVFKKKYIRNEIKGVRKPFIVIANHESALDFVNLIGATSKPMSFVISQSFFSTLPVKGIMQRMGVIPKQQFQTSASDLKQMKNVIDNGGSIVIYPAGLMCEDGLSTPIPSATYKFLRWLGVDVYVAKNSGTYFVMPKWTGGIRPGRTYIDIYKLFSAEELKTMKLDEIEAKTNEALLFDAYREQEKFLVKYRGNSKIEGLEHVLYMCPNCGKEYSIHVKDSSIIFCDSCGFELKCDEYAFMHKTSNVGEEIRYVSDWSKHIYAELKKKVISGEISSICSDATIRMIDERRHKFVDVGEGHIELDSKGFTLKGKINGKEADIFASITNVPSLPFSPGKYLEIQQGRNIYRCVLSDGRLVMKFINLVKIFYELNKGN